MSLFSVLLGTMKTDFLIGGPKGIMLRKVTNGFEIRNFDGTSLKNLTVDSLTAATSVSTDSIVEKTLDAGVTIESVNIKNGVISNVTDPTQAQDAATKAYADSVASSATSSANDYADGIVATEAGIRSDADIALDGRLDTLEGQNLDTRLTSAEGSLINKDGTVAFTGNQSMGSHKLTNLADPTQAQDAATKSYTDGLASGVKAKASVRVATTGALDVTPSGAKVGKTLTANNNGALVVDGITLIANDRVLVKNQVDAKDNGVYSVTYVGDINNPFVLTRANAEDGVPSIELTAGCFFFVREGAASASSGYIITSPAEGDVDVDVTAINLTQFSSAGQIEAGAGLDKSGNVISLNVNDLTVLGQSVADGDELAIYDVTNSVQRKITKANLVTGLATEIYADTAASDAQTAAESYADGVAATAESNAKSYADGLAVNYDAAGSADAAEAAAIAAAALDATAKADAAEANANDYTDTAIAGLSNGTGVVAGASKHIRVSVATTDASSTYILPENAVVKSVTCVVKSAYSSGATLQVVVDGATDLEIMATSDNDAETVASYKSEDYSTVAAANVGTIKVVVAGSPIAGSADVIVEFVESFLA